VQQCLKHCVVDVAVRQLCDMLALAREVDCKDLLCDCREEDKHRHRQFPNRIDPRQGVDIEVLESSDACDSRQYGIENYVGEKALQLALLFRVVV
jgi:hypothetical protein